MPYLTMPDYARLPIRSRLPGGTLTHKRRWRKGMVPDLSPLAPLISHRHLDGERLLRDRIFCLTTIDAHAGGLQANSPGKRDIVPPKRNAFFGELFAQFLGEIRGFLKASAIWTGFLGFFEFAFKVRRIWG